MAKMIKFNLTLSGATVSTFDELQDNFSADILPIYRTGRLLKWLQARELTEQVQAVQAITPSDDDRGLLGALCRALDLDDDAEVINFLLEDWQASQERQTAVQTAPTALADSDTQSAEIEGEVDGAVDSASAAEPVDWSGQDLSGRNFEGADLRNGIFVNTNFEGCNFDDANLKNANLSGANLIKCSFARVDLSNANLTSAKINSASGSQANFDNANLTNSSIGGCLFEFSSFQGAIFEDVIVGVCGYPPGGAKFLVCDFKNANLKESTLWVDMGGRAYYVPSFMEFIECDFDGADLSFSETKLENFNSCNLKSANTLGISGIDKSFIDDSTEQYLTSRKEK